MKELFCGRECKNKNILSHFFNCYLQLCSLRAYVLYRFLMCCFSKTKTPSVTKIFPSMISLCFSGCIILYF